MLRAMNRQLSNMGSAVFPPVIPFGLARVDLTGARCLQGKRSRCRPGPLIVIFAKAYQDGVAGGCQDPDICR